MADYRYNGKTISGTLYSDCNTESTYAEYYKGLNVIPYYSGDYWTEPLYAKTYKINGNANLKTIKPGTKPGFRNSYSTFTTGTAGSYKLVRTDAALLIKKWNGSSWADFRTLARGTFCDNTVPYKIIVELCAGGGGGGGGNWNTASSGGGGGAYWCGVLSLDGFEPEITVGAGGSAGVGDGGSGGNGGDSTIKIGGHTITCHGGKGCPYGSHNDISGGTYSAYSDVIYGVYWKLHSASGGKGGWFNGGNVAGATIYATNKKEDQKGDNIKTLSARSGGTYHRGGGGGASQLGSGGEAGKHEGTSAADRSGRSGSGYGGGGGGASDGFFGNNPSGGAGNGGYFAIHY